MNNHLEIAIVAAGCFWGVQAYFDQVPGVVTTEVGYTGGHTKNPTYEQVCTHTTGHVEAVKITFDPHRTTYRDLLRHFFRMHDPTQVNGQGPDIGDSYRSAVFYTTRSQQAAVTHLIQELQPSFEEPIATEVAKASEFYLAETYHQKYFEKTGRGECHIPYTL